MSALATCGLVQAPFPKYGSTPFRVEGMYSPSASQTTTPISIYRSGAQLRVETVLPRLGRSTIVFDRGSNAAYALAPISSYAALAATSLTPPTPTPAGAQSGAPSPPSVAPLAPGMAGMAIRISDADAPQPFETSWAALGPDNSQAVGLCRVAGERGQRWRARNPMKDTLPRTACVTNDGIVLEIREGDKPIFEATHVQRGRISPALFNVPANYQRFDPQAVAATEAPTTPPAITSLAPAG